MRLFNCQACSNPLYFENRFCMRCNHQLGYLPTEFNISAIEPTLPGAPNGRFHALAVPGREWKHCANTGLDACNWMIPADSHDEFCTACRHNRTVPNLSQPENMVAWRKLEVAKHRLVYTLTRLGLPLENRDDAPGHGLAFDFLADSHDPAIPKVLTGHDEGEIVVALQEADDAERERRRTQMGEPYRTLMGHFRHEVGHYYWNVLVRDQDRLEQCRAVFGDDEEDYDAALARHYKEGPPPDWQEHFVSNYASTHAWEDFAETWAHYLHIIDCLETAVAFGIEVHPRVANQPGMGATARINPYKPGHFDALINEWLPLTYAMNSMNRSMGLGDLYPFILSPAVVNKLAFIHDLVHLPRTQAALAA